MNERWVGKIFLCGALIMLWVFVGSPTAWGALDNKGTIWDTDDFCDYRKRVYKEAFDRILELGAPVKSPKGFRNSGNLTG